MEWFLIITLLNSNDLLVKQIPSKQECIQIKNDFLKKYSKNKNSKSIKKIYCEKGQLFEIYNTQENTDEVL